MARPRKTQQQQQQTSASSKNPNHRPSEAVFSNWSVSECQLLVDYIKKHGFDGDVKKICDHFPGHTETNIRHFMNELTTRTIEDDPDWIMAGKFEGLQGMARTNNLSQSYGSVQPTFVEWMALFVDEHAAPHPEEGAIDYADIYRSVAALMRGEIPRQLDACTAAKFLAILDSFFYALKALLPGTVPLPAWFKKPVVSTIKTRQQCNATLANRRSLEPTAAERAKADLLTSADLATVRQVYLTPAWANPFRYPDEPSQFRLRKLVARRMKQMGHQVDGSAVAVMMTMMTAKQEPVFDGVEPGVPLSAIKQEPIYEMSTMEPAAKTIKCEDEEADPKPRKAIRRRRRRRY